MSETTNNRRGFLGSLLRAVLYFLVFGAVLLVGLKFLGNAGIGPGAAADSFVNNLLAPKSSLPKEVQIKYVPADFFPQIDEENALIFLQNPVRYNHEFNELIHDFNISLLNHVANRMGLDSDVKQAMRTSYESHHPYIERLYFNDFMALRDTTASDYEAWYGNENSNVVETLKEVASKYTCFMINLVMADVIPTFDGKIEVRGDRADTPCGVALMEGFTPMIDRLQERAAIEDFSRAKGFLEERVEKVIAELATMEVRDRKGLSRQLKTKMFGMNVSSTDLEISAISIMKVGFDLSKYFDISIEPERNRVVVTLPPAQILSHEVYPKIDNLDIGWLREVGSVDFNENFNLLRREFRREAMESDVFDKAEAEANELMTTMLLPTVKSLDPKMKLVVQFRNQPSEFRRTVSDDGRNLLGLREDL